MGWATRILLISGSVRAGSTNAALLATAAVLAGENSIAGENGIAATTYPGLGALPHFNPDDDRDPLPPAVGELRASIAGADAVLFCTPEYAGDLPGSFKNLLDWTVGGMEIVDKPVAWVNVSSSGTAAAGAHRALRTVLTYTGAAIIEPACRHVPVPRQAVGDDGLIRDPAVREQVADVLATLVRHVAAGATTAAPAD